MLEKMRGVVGRILRMVRAFFFQAHFWKRLGQRLETGALWGVSEKYQGGLGNIQVFKSLLRPYFLKMILCILIK